MRRITLFLTLLGIGAAAAKADQQAIVGWIERFFAARDSGEREKLADLIANDPDFDRALMSEWLHKAKLFAPVETGVSTLDVALPDLSVRKLTVHVPANYRPDRPWPVIYALHEPGANGAAVLAQVQKTLGSLAEAFIVAAPENYGDALLGEGWPPTQEHSACLSLLRKSFHLNSDRVYLFGIGRRTGASTGAGDAAWTMALIYSDQFAAGVIGDGALRLPGGTALFSRFSHNLQHLPLLVASPTSDDSQADAALTGKLNEQLFTAALKSGPKPPWKMLGPRTVEAVLSNERWPADQLQAQLALGREHAPRKVRHVFRHISQAHAYWLEGREWVGAKWDDKPFGASSATTNPAEADAAFVRNLDSRLGELSGDIKDQNITVGRKGVTEVTVWLSDGMVQFSQPVRILTGGETAFFGTVQPDVLFCLTQAERTRDFDLLRWSAITLKGRTKGHVLTAAELR